MESRTPDDEQSQYSESYRRALGRTIKVVRTDQSIKRTKLAEDAGITYSSLTEIENGNRAPSPTRLERIASALGLRSSQLVQAAEERMELEGTGRTPSSLREESTDSVRHRSPSSRLFSTGAYAMQPSLRGSRRDLRTAVMELERLMQVMAPEDVERLLDYARRLAR